MRRLLMYDAVELEKYDLAKEYAESFMNEGGDAKYIYLDYVYYGRLMSNLGEKEKAYAQLEKALEIDPTKVEMYKELGELYERDGDYINAIRQYQNFIDKGEDKVTLSDFFTVGKLNYYAASDTAAVYAADNYLGHFWLARTNSLKDPESTLGLAKPHYEKVIEILEAAGRNQNQLIEAYRYLGYYYYVTGKLAESIPYWEKILTIKPDDAVAKQALEGIKAEMNS